MHSYTYDTDYGNHGIILAYLYKFPFRTYVPIPDFKVVQNANKPIEYCVFGLFKQRMYFKSDTYLNK